MTQVPKAIMVDLTHETLSATIKELMIQRGLTNCEMELILTQLLADIKTAKEKDYAETILDLTYQLQQLEYAKENEEKGELEPEMTVITNDEAKSEQE